MGDELEIVNDARISFNRNSETLNENDIKLIRYLLKHDHTSPFRSNVFKFKIKAPLFIARQIWKHCVASSYVDDQRSFNEQSLRYTEITPEFYIPKDFYKQSQSNKQASSAELVEKQSVARELYQNSLNFAYNNYVEMLNEGVSKEAARGILPVCTYTSFVWTISLQSLIHFINLREASGAQNEIRFYANALKLILQRTHYQILYEKNN